MQLSNAYLISKRGTKNQLTKSGVYLGCFDLSILLFELLGVLWMVEQRGFGCETIHPTENSISMNLLQMSCVITRAILKSSADQ